MDIKLVNKNTRLLHFFKEKWRDFPRPLELGYQHNRGGKMKLTF